MSHPTYPEGIWFVDFEFHPANSHEGNPPVPVCMVAQELLTGTKQKVWRDDLIRMDSAPFPTGEKSLIVAYYASAEIGCFIQLGWPQPTNILDLFVEFRRHTNGRPVIAGKGLTGALAHFGLKSIGAVEKDLWRELILSGGPWNDQEKNGILDYCDSDVIAMLDLYPKMLPFIDWPRALLRGRYSAAVANIESAGIPIDMEIYLALKENWGLIKQFLVEKLDAKYGVYEDLKFKYKLFEKYLIGKNIAWPVLSSGKLDLSDETFKGMARTNPELNELHELRNTLSKLKLSEISVGEDGRNRCLLSIYGSITGRNQPSTSKYIFGPAVWLRGLIKPRRGYGIAYIDWSQQEFGIAAALSKDPTMMNAYRSGDPYLAFAKEAGAVPTFATKRSHPFEREQFKACVLAVQYGMGPEALAHQIKQPVARARQLLELHRKTFKVFWSWIDGVLNQALLVGKLHTVFGWQLNTPDKPNPRSLANFPMQSNGAEMLRLACVSLINSGITVCATVHDAILIEAKQSELDDAVKKTKDIMRRASAEVLGGFELESDIAVFSYPNRYMDKRGKNMWGLIMQKLALEIEN
jgi:hypothetical protein